MTSYTSLKDDLLIDGVSLQSMPGIVVSDFPLFSSSARRGESDTIPGRRGQVPSRDRPLDAFTLNIPIHVLADATGTQAQQRVQMIDRLRALAAILRGSNGIVLLTRRLQADNSDGYVEHQAVGEFVQGTSPSMIVSYAGKTELEFINHSGCWYDKNFTTTSSLSVDVPGDFATRNIQLTLPGPGVLTNTTLGIWVAVTQASVLDVENYTATSGLSTLQHGGSTSWMELAVGTNNFTWSGSGSPSIAVKSAWV